MLQFVLNERDSLSRSLLRQTRAYRWTLPIPRVGEKVVLHGEGAESLDQGPFTVEEIRWVVGDGLAMDAPARVVVELRRNRV